jgi:hypothetical protein
MKSTTKCRLCNHTNIAMFDKGIPEPWLATTFVNDYPILHPFQRQVHITSGQARATFDLFCYSPAIAGDISSSNSMDRSTYLLQLLFWLHYSPALADTSSGEQKSSR